MWDGTTKKKKKKNHLLEQTENYVYCSIWLCTPERQKVLGSYAKTLHNLSILKISPQDLTFKPTRSSFNRGSYEIKASENNHIAVMWTESCLNPGLPGAPEVGKQKVMLISSNTEEQNNTVFSNSQKQSWSYMDALLLHITYACF